MQFLDEVIMNRKIECGRKPKGSDNLDPLPLPNEEEENYDIIEEEEEDEEVDFDNPTFRRDQIWSDYAEDLDYDQ